MTHLYEKALLPCPFCGKEPIVTRTVEDDNFDRWFHVRCEECAIEIGDEYRSDAINTWNRRASSALPPSPVSELVERLEKRAKTMNGSLVGASDGGTYALGYYDQFAAKDDKEAASTLTALSTRNAELEREVKRLRRAAGNAYRACMSAWACGEPPHRVKTMVEEVERLGVVIGDAGAVALSTSPQGGEHE